VIRADLDAWTPPAVDTPPAENPAAGVGWTRHPRGA